MNIKKWLLQLSVIAVIVGITTACSDNKSSGESTNAQNKPEREATENAPNGSSVLAQVNDTTITEDDLERLLLRVGGENALAFQAQALSNENSRKNMLESLISSRAMALSSEKALNDHDLVDLNKKVAAYREELLVKNYLNEHANVQAVSNTMVKEYYQKHQQEFSDESQYHFEVLTSYGELSDVQRKQVIKAFGQAKTNTDWKQLEKKLIKSQLPIRYQKAKARLSLLTPDIQELLKKTASPSAISKTSISEVLVKPIIKVIKVLEVIPGALKPLAEVSANIRKRLAPVMMKQAIAEASKQARANVEISYQSP
jgi:hypothetical protein